MDFPAVKHVVVDWNRIAQITVESILQSNEQDIMQIFHMYVLFIFFNIFKVLKHIKLVLMTLQQQKKGFISYLN
jgi:hypothetical protein